MSPEEIRNQCEDDADRAPSDLTVWRDRGAIIAAQQTRIQRAQELADEIERDGWVDSGYIAAALREALS